MSEVLYVPIGLAENSDYRRHILTLAYDDRQLQAELWILCCRDINFFINTFAWILESRDSADWQIEGRIGTKEIPFILRDYQRDAIMKILDSLGREDIVISKSRETGVSWLLIAIACWDWLFHGQTHTGFVSKDEDSCDNPDDPDSLFSKFEFLFKRLPQWMKPRFQRNLQKHTWKNIDNESTITGYAATGNVARGGRKRWMVFDEFHSFPAGKDQEALDSSVFVTDCRIFVSTPNRVRGPSGAYYELMCDESKSGSKIIIDWKDDIEKRRGLYHSQRVHDSETFALVIDDVELWDQYKNEDGTYRHPTKTGELYKFVLDGKVRSLYYDDYCRRPGVTSRSVASELDRNFAGAASTVCDLDLINRAIERAKPPIQCGEVYQDPTDAEKWIFDWSIPEGSVKLWTELNGDRLPSEDEFVAGMDVAAGTGGAKSSYSALEVFNKKTGENVFEWRSNRVDPIKFASLAVFICRWFNNAYMVPEINGPTGSLFIQEVIKLRYLNVYKRKKSGVRSIVISDYLGYWNADKGLALLEGMQAAIANRRAHVNSEVALREMGRYLYSADGAVMHSLASSEEDMSGKGKAHGDAAIALCVAWCGVDEWPAAKAEEATREPPYGSFLWRRLEYEKTQKQKGHKAYWSPFK